MSTLPLTPIWIKYTTAEKYGLLSQVVSTNNLYVLVYADTVDIVKLSNDSVSFVEHPINPETGELFTPS